MKRREDGAVREVMKELLRSDLRFHKTRSEERRVGERV